eukprot:jgi/Picsp_1/1418/NSC_04897-R1_protein
MGRSRSRSRERYRRRSRSRSRERSRRSSSRDGYERGRYGDGKGDERPSVAMQIQQQQLALQQDQMQRQLLAQQLGGQVNFGTGGELLTDRETQEKKQREIYVGNLAIGAVNASIVEEFFNQALSHLVPDPIRTPPVINVNMDGQGRFAFIELRDAQLANQAMLMDKIVEIYGRHIHVGRPKGYIENYQPEEGKESEHSMPTVMTVEKEKPTRVLLLANILPAEEVRKDSVRKELVKEVKKEAKKHGAVESVAIPTPPESCHDRGPGRVYVMYKTVEDAEKSKQVFHGRTLNDSTIYARFASEDEFQQALEDQWVSREKKVAGIELPGLYIITPLSSGVAGLTILNPSLATLIQKAPAMVEMIASTIEEEEVPFEEGWVKLRGFPTTVTKDDIIAFFKGCGNLSHEDIKAVHSADGTPLGEAYIHFHGPDAKLRLALSRDKSKLPKLNTPAQVLTSFEEDMNRRMYSGCQML